MPKCWRPLPRRTATGSSKICPTGFRPLSVIAGSSFHLANASGIKLSDYVRQASLDRIGRRRQSDLVEADAAAGPRANSEFEQRVRELSRMMPKSGAEGQARKEGLRP